MIAAVRSIPAACKSAIFVAWLDLGIGSNVHGVLVRFPLGVCREVNYIGFLELICGHSTDLLASLFANRRSFELVWSGTILPEHLNQYRFSVRQVCDDPERVLTSTKCSTDDLPVPGSDI